MFHYAKSCAEVRGRSTGLRAPEIYTRPIYPDTWKQKQFIQVGGLEFFAIKFEGRFPDCIVFGLILICTPLLHIAYGSTASPPDRFVAKCCIYAKGPSPSNNISRSCHQYAFLNTPV